MRKIVFILLTFISLNVFAQSDTFKVKEGSFHHVQGCVTIPAHTDQNDLPMGVIKIIPENINEQQRMKLKFEGNLATGIEVVQKEGETWVYVTARAVTFIRIKHPDFGVTEYYPPMEIEANQCYEMVLQNLDKAHKSVFVAINTEPSGAYIFIDGKGYGHTPNMITDVGEGEHELKLEKNGYESLTKKLVVGVEDIHVNETMKRIVAEEEKKQIAQAQTEEEERQEASENEEPEIEDVNGFVFVDLGLPSGVKWASCNVGAESPDAYGSYFAWGEPKTKTNFGSGSMTKGKDVTDIGGKSRYDAARSNWGAPWRMPTKAEFQELADYCVWEWVSLRGKKGYKITGPNDNIIFLPAAGCKRGTSLSSANQYGYYWCSESYGPHGDSACDLQFHSNSISIHWNNRDYGLSIRPVL